MTFGGYPFAGGPFGGSPSFGGPGDTGQVSRSVLLLSGRDSDRATITAAAQVPTLPATNLQTIQPRRVFRVMGTSASLTLAFQAAVACDMLALVGGNPTVHRRIRVTGATTLGGLEGSPTVDTDWINPWPGGVVPDVLYWPSWLLPVFWENDTALQYWRIDITDDGGGLTYIDIGRLILGRAWRPSTNFDFGGMPLAFDPRDVVAETDYGYTFTDRRTRSAPRLFSLQLSAASETEVLRGLQEIQRLAGTAGDVVCCLDPGDNDYFHLFSLQGRFTKGAGFGAPALWDDIGRCWSASIELREFL